MKADKWEQYHQTRKALLKAISTHQNSIAVINVYNSGSNKDIPLNTSGDWSLFNESMGTIEMQELRKKLTK